MTLESRISTKAPPQSRMSLPVSEQGNIRIHDTSGTGNELVKKFDVSVIGLGYVGLPLCLAFAKSGYRVLGVDVDIEKTTLIQNGQSYIKHIDSSQISEAVKSEQFEASSDFLNVRDADAILICVPTPLTQHRTPDLSYVEGTARSIAPFLQPGQLIVLESTTYPGTTREVVLPILEKGSGLIAGRDFHLAFSPEREDPGNPHSNFKEVPKVVGGLTEKCLNAAEELYSTIVSTVVKVPSCDVAEATKLTENIFRSVNIALVNELKVIFSKMGIDVWEVINAAATKPFGFMPFYPGPGLGGHCIPIDPFYLSWKALEFGERTRLIELAGEINTAMPEYVVSRVVDALNDKSKSVRGSKILLLGLAYKANVEDDRESPTYAIMGLLEGRGAKVSYNDPHIPAIQAGRSHMQFSGRCSQPIDKSYDVIVLCTAHEEYRHFNFRELDIPFVDCRNFAQNIPAANYAA